MTVRQIVDDLEANQKPHRLLHIYGVLQTCLSLAELHGGDKQALTLAALLHDCAKHLDREQMQRLNQAGKITLDRDDLEYPAIWHGAVGAWIAREHYGVTDEEILHAVEHHTLGAPHPSLTLQILMCADFCEPTRTHPHVAELRQLIRADLKKGLLTVLNRKIEDLIQRNQKPHPRIYETIKSLENLIGSTSKTEKQLIG